MNAPSLSELRGSIGVPVRDPGDEKMDQIRELLVGEHVRRSDERLALLETRLLALEKEMAQRFDAMAARFEALAGATEADRRTGLEELARGMTDLGERLRRLAKG